MSLRQRVEKEIREVARMELALLSNLSPAKKLELIGEIQERQTRIEIMRRANEEGEENGEDTKITTRIHELADRYIREKHAGRVGRL